MTEHAPEDTPTPAPDEKAGPFAVGPVDGLVFQQSDDIPELRPAAAYVSAGPRLIIRETLPPVAPPVKRQHTEWVPDGDAGPAPAPAAEPQAWGRYTLRALRTVAFLVLLLAPMAGVAWLVRYALELYS